MSASTVFLVVGVLTVAYIIMVYNRLTTYKNRFLNAFSQIDVQLQRRYELIPNLVEIASKYLKHENETLTSVIAARNTASKQCQQAAANPQDASLVGALAKAEQSLGSALGRLNMVMEDYPELKADESLRDLHIELASTENKVAYSRQSYSDAVMQYNNAREQFPALLVAKACTFREADLFELANEEAQAPVRVSFA